MTDVAFSAYRDSPAEYAAGETVGLFCKYFFSKDNKLDDFIQCAKSNKSESKTKTAICAWKDKNNSNNVDENQ